MKAKITKTLLKSLEPQDKPHEIKDTEITGFHIRIYPTGKISYYYAYTNLAGRRQRILIGNTSQLTVQQARDAVTRYAADVANGVDVQSQKKIQKQQKSAIHRLTLRIFMQQHYQSWAVSHLKTGQENVKMVLRLFEAYLDRPLTDFTVEVMETWRTQELNRGQKPSTVNRDVARLKGVLSKAVQWKLIPLHPFQGMSDLKTDKKPIIRYLSETEYSRLMKALSERDQALKKGEIYVNEAWKKRHGPDRAELQRYRYADKMEPMIILSLKAGLRQGEVFDLTWQCVDFRQGIIVVVGDKAKSGQTRYVPMAPSVQDALQAWYAQQPSSPDPLDYVFPNDHGQRLRYVYRQWTDILNRAQITRFRWHDMRHDFASQLIMRGVAAKVVQELCGHASFATTERYLALAEGHKTNAVALLDTPMTTLTQKEIAYDPRALSGALDDPKRSHPENELVT